LGDQIGEISRRHGVLGVFCGPCWTKRWLAGHFQVLRGVDNTSPDMCGYSYPSCLSRLLSTKGLLFLSLLIAGGMNVTWSTLLMMVGTYFYWWIVTLL